MVIVLGSIDIKYFRHAKCYWTLLVYIIKFWNCEWVCPCVCVITAPMVLLTCYPEPFRNNSSMLSGLQSGDNVWTSLIRRITCLCSICDKDSFLDQTLGSPESFFQLGLDLGLPRLSLLSLVLARILLNQFIQNFPPWDLITLGIPTSPPNRWYLIRQVFD